MCANMDVEQLKLSLWDLYACDLTVCDWYVKQMTELSIVQHSLYILIMKRFQIAELT